MEALIAIGGLLAFPIMLGALGAVLDRLPERSFDRLFHLFGFKDHLS